MYLSVPCTCPPDKSYVCAECLRKQQGPTRYLIYLDQTQVPPYPPPDSKIMSKPKSKAKIVGKDVVIETPCYACSQQDQFPVQEDYCRCPVFSRIISSSPPWICYACNKYIERQPSLPTIRPSPRSTKQKSVDTQVFQKDFNKIPEESGASGVGCLSDVIISPPPGFRAPGDTSSKSSSSSPSPKPDHLRKSPQGMFQSRPMFSPQGTSHDPDSLFIHVPTVCAFNDSRGTAGKSDFSCQSRLRSSPEPQSFSPSGPSAIIISPRKNSMSAAPETRDCPRSHLSSPCFRSSSPGRYSGRSASRYVESQGAGIGTSDSSRTDPQFSGGPVFAGTSTATKETLPEDHSIKDSASYYWVTEETDKESMFSSAASQSARTRQPEDGWPRKPKCLCYQNSSPGRQETGQVLSSQTESDLSPVRYECTRQHESASPSRKPTTPQFRSSAISSTPGNRKGIYEKSSNARQSRSSQASELSSGQSPRSTTTQSCEEGSRTINGKSDCACESSNPSSPYTGALDPRTSPPILKVLTAGQPKPTPKKVDFACQSPTHRRQDFHVCCEQSSLATSTTVYSDESNTSTHALPRTSPYSGRSSPRTSAGTQYGYTSGPGSVQSFYIREEARALEEKSSDTSKSLSRESPNSRRRSPRTTRDTTPFTGTASGTPTTASAKSDFACQNVYGECQSSVYCSTPGPRCPTSFGGTYTTSTPSPKSDFACQNSYGMWQDSGPGHKSSRGETCTPTASPPEFVCQSSRGDSPEQLYSTTSGHRYATMSGRTDSPSPASGKTDFACQSLYGASHLSRSSFTRSDRSSPSRITTPAASTSPLRSDRASQVVTHMSQSSQSRSLGQRSVPKFRITSESVKSVNSSRSDSRTSQHSYHGDKNFPQNLPLHDTVRAKSHTRSDRSCTRVSRSTQDSCNDSVHSTRRTPIFLDKGDASMTQRHSKFPCERACTSTMQPRQSSPHTKDHSKTSLGRSDLSGESAHRVSPGLPYPCEEKAASDNQSIMTDTSLTPPGQYDFACQDLHYDSQRSQHGSTGRLRYIPECSTATTTSPPPKSDSACHSLRQASHRPQQGSSRRPSSTPGSSTTTMSSVLPKPEFACQTLSRETLSAEFAPAPCMKTIPILCVTDESSTSPAQINRACQGVYKTTRSVQCCSIPSPWSNSTIFIPDKSEYSRFARQHRGYVPPSSRPEVKTVRDPKVAGTGKADMPSVKPKFAVSGHRRSAHLSKTNATPTRTKRNSFLKPTSKQGFSLKTASTKTSLSSSSRSLGPEGSLKCDRHKPFDMSGSPAGPFERTDKTSVGVLPSSMNSSQDGSQQFPQLFPLLSPATGSGSTTEQTHPQLSRNTFSTRHPKSSSKTTAHTGKDWNVTPSLSTIVSLSRASRGSATTEEVETKRISTGAGSDFITPQTPITSKKSPPSGGDSLTTGKCTSTTHPTITVTSHSTDSHDQFDQGAVGLLSLLQGGEKEKSMKKSASASTDYVLQSRLLCRRKPSHLCENIRQALKQKLTKKSTSVMAESWKKPTILIRHSASLKSESCRRLRDARQATLSGLQAFGVEGARDTTHLSKATQDDTSGRTGGQSQQPSFSDQIIKITPCHSDYKWQGCARPKLSSLLRAAGASAKMSSSCHENSKGTGHTFSTEACVSQFSSSVDSLKRPPWDNSFSNCLDREDSYTNLMVEIRQKCGPPRPLFGRRRKKGARPPWQHVFVQKRPLTKSTWNAPTLNCNWVGQPPWNPFFK